MKIEDMAAPAKTMDEIQERKGMRKALRDAVNDFMMERGIETHSHVQDLTH